MPKLFCAPNYTEEQIEKMEVSEIHFPYSDKWLTYDSVKRQYIPTEALLIANGLEEMITTDPTNRNNLLKHISDQIYAFCHRSSGSNTEIIKWIIARGFRRGTSPYRFRKLFEEVMWKQARYFNINGDLSTATGVSLFDKRFVEKGVMRLEDREIDPTVKTILTDLGLAWVGSYDTQLRWVVQQEDW